MHKISSDEQLAKWVAGESLHRDVDGIKGGECCPDFSCCKPDLLQPPDVRQAFAAADEATRYKFLGTFLAAMIAVAVPEKKVHIAGRGEGE